MKKQNLKAIFIDCDGVLSTGSFFYDSTGKAFKEFSSMDGKGFKKARDNNVLILVITEEPDKRGFEITKKRCDDQNIELIKAKNAHDKLIIATSFCKKNNIELKDTAFIADDIGDWELFTKVGFPIAVNNAHETLVEYSKNNRGYVTKRFGGRGAVREGIEWVIEKILICKT